MKNLDEVIKSTIGISKDADKLTPMDKGECKLVAQEWATEVVKNLTLHIVNGSKLDRISRMKELFEKGLVRFDGKAAKEAEYLIMGVDIGNGKDESMTHIYCR